VTHTTSATESLTIGELALRTGVSAETIRYYEREGVVPRAARRGAGHYRRYEEGDAERLRFVRRARDLGFSLDEVRELLALANGSPSRSCADVNRIARAHLAQVDTKLAQLAALRVELDRVIGECDGEVPVSDCRILGALSGEPRVSSPLAQPVPESGRRRHARGGSVKRKS
jgi:DNA-binding transcriptional MerR regulator